MSIYTDYSIQVDCLLTWFPVKNSATLKEPKMRMGTYQFKTSDPDFVFSGGGTHSFRTHWGRGGLNDDSLEPRRLVGAFTIIEVDKNEVFTMEILLDLGRSHRNQRLFFQSNTTTPFLINLRAAQEEDPELNDTALSFQGVVTASHRRSDLIYFATHIIRR